MTKTKMRVLALVLFVVGLVVPRVIDAYETAYRLDIKREIGVLPWLMMSALGIGLLLLSFRKRQAASRENPAQ